MSNEELMKRVSEIVESTEVERLLTGKSEQEKQDWINEFEAWMIEREDHLNEG